MTAIITAVLALLQNILPLVTSSDTVAKVIAALIEIVPVLVKEAQDLVQPVKNIIASLQSNPATTQEQFDALTALDAKVDADFEASAAAALKEDSAE